jgi:zinc protease
MNARSVVYSAGIAFALATSASIARAQHAALDRNVAPPIGAAPALHVPKWTQSKLTNGAQLVVVEKHDLPLVAVTLSFVGGAANYEPADKTGLASLTAQMLSEGTNTRNSDQLTDAQQLLGTRIFAGVGLESGSLNFTALKDKVEPAVQLMADMLLHPTFPQEALDRLQGRAAVALAQNKDQPAAIAANVFPRVVYGDNHPYGRVASERSIKSITRDDLVAFHRAYFRPGRAVITVSGDVSPATVKAMMEKVLKDWPAGGERPSFEYSALPAPNPTTIYLVDKPKAAQSIFALGLPGPSRDTPDYYALQVMNNILGTLFQSRLNHTLREVKAYTYSARSVFSYGRGPGSFQANAQVVTAKTDSALIEFIRELKGVQGAIPFTDDEMLQGKQSLIMGLPTRFASVNATGGSIGSIYTQHLPESYFQEYAKNVEAVQREDLVRVAKKYIDLDHLNILIVGDRSVVEGPLRATGIAPLVLLDGDGRRVTATP